MKRLLIGAAAGAAATLPMTVVMETLHERLPGEPPRPLPPREVLDGIAAQAGVHDDLEEEDKENLTLAIHFGYGAACGAVFGSIAPRSLPAAVASGMAFGVGIWAGSYLGWLPALGVRHHAKFDPGERSALMIAAHLVWGGVTGALVSLPRTAHDFPGSREEE